ncbi:alginate biosynthesis TPR repeat lipoprotein AlgK [Pseudomonas taeanensis]|uniref:alginate biosynthesis TPR repeat lipoprotein AlgK n=1 Tax=Pseudomonas taeanensis TaxID=574962 RepID=UPI0004BB5558|nr:alginate biosynthesis TPR repeat lipoprotein AlgK [Pseudomonas taeanensis]
MTYSQPQRLLLVAALSLAGCAGLPDQRLANQALQSGDTATAEQNYRQLAELGYSDAQVGLADIQQASGDPELLRQAEATYRQAADSSPRAAARLGKLLARKPDVSESERQEAEQLLEQAFANGQESALLPLTLLYLQYPQSFPSVSVQQRINQWRAAGYPQAELAQLMVYRTQGNYDQHLDDVQRICKQALSTADVCYVELATVYQKRGQREQQAALLNQLQTAYRSGSVPARRVDDVAQVLADPELGTPDEKTAQQLLEQLAPSYPAAWVSLARLLYDYPALGDIEQLLEYLEQGRNAALPRAELLLGKLYYEGKLLPRNPQKAEHHLLKAAPSENSAHYYLGQLYRRGYLGHVAPAQALQHLLTAARGGQNSADYALAQMFSQGRGIKPNLVNAYVFSQLAVQQDKPEALPLAAEIERQLPASARAEAQRLLHEEQRLRGTVQQSALTRQAGLSQTAEELQ